MTSNSRHQKLLFSGHQDIHGWLNILKRYRESQGCFMFDATRALEHHIELTINSHLDKRNNVTSISIHQKLLFQWSSGHTWLADILKRYRKSQGHFIFEATRALEHHFELTINSHLDKRNNMTYISIHQKLLFNWSSGHTWLAQYSSKDTENHKAVSSLKLPEHESIIKSICSKGQ